MTDQPIATIKQRNYIGLLFNMRGFHSDQSRIDFIQTAVGVETHPGKAVLTRAQAARVIEALKRVPTTPVEPEDDLGAWQD